jgi:hypothetical protein
MCSAISYAAIYFEYAINEHKEQQGMEIARNTFIKYA